jgi:serine/threonine protein kinase
MTEVVVGARGNLLSGHPRYRKLQDLNEGTFGVVMLALDTYTNEQVGTPAAKPALLPLQTNPISPS